MSRFDYVKYDEASEMVQHSFKGVFVMLADHVEKSLPEGRAKSLALTKIEEAYMWIGKSLRDGQIARNGTAELQEARSNS